jgi:23S rRNA (cytosine1962-C5)-methyltransferase
VVVAPRGLGPLRRRHPWLYSIAVERVVGTPAPGDIVAVVDRRGRLWGQGYYNPRSRIVVRLLSFDDRPLDEEFWRGRLARAIAAREGLLAITDARRLVHAESDGLPGLVVDAYGEFLVLQALTLGIELRKEFIVSILRELLGPRGIYERSDVAVRAKEGLPGSQGPLWGDLPPARLPVREGKARLLVDIAGGHKTGLYLDQRDNRLLVSKHAAGREVLDIFCYTGAFGIQAALGGARSVLFLETSARHLRWARDQLSLNGLEHIRAGFVAGDAFQELRRLVRERRRFDLVVLDPPKFARSRGELAGALRGYNDLNRLALGLLRPGGLLFTFSCSGRVGWQELWRALGRAAVDARREVQILRRLSQAEDHPVSVFYPEGEYLRGFLARVG